MRADPGSSAPTAAKPNTGAGHPARVRTAAEAIRAVLRPVALSESEGRERPVAAVLVLLRAQEGGLEVLLGRRAQRPGDPWSGQISLPGGRHHPSDGSLLGTALRETREETNLVLEGRAEILGRLRPRAPANVPGMSVVPFVALGTAALDPEPGPEMEETFWAPLTDLPPSSGRTVVTTLLGELDVPAFLWRDRVIWGFTYRVLDELLGLLEVSR